ncbi:ABC transporter substrate-binding protein [Peptoniphilaceae bacterium SGI.131]
MLKKYRLILAIMMSLVILLSACTKKETSNKPVDQKVSGEENGKKDEDKKIFEKPEKLVIRALKGPTAMGMAKLVNDNFLSSLDSSSKVETVYDFQVLTDPQEIVKGLVENKITVAAIPTNLAATVFNKTKGKISLLATNTLGVLYIVENGNAISSVSDLKGKTIYMTGQGATPEYILNSILNKAGLKPGQDVSVEFKSEASEVAQILATKKDVVAMLPEPFVSASQLKNKDIRIAVDLNKEFKNIYGSDIVTGVLVAQRDFAEKYGEFLEEFLNKYKLSIGFASTDKEEFSKLVEKLDIVKAPVVLKALERLNISYMDKKEMKENVEKYLQILFDANPKAIGGSMPSEEFYYMGK